MRLASLRTLSAEIVRCRACPRLVAWREEVARAWKPALGAFARAGRAVHRPAPRFAHGAVSRSSRPAGVLLRPQGDRRARWGGRTAARARDPGWHAAC